MGVPLATWHNVSNYPSTKPGALRLLAPQRGLIAIGQNQNREPFMIRSFFPPSSFLRNLGSRVLGERDEPGFSALDETLSEFRVAFHLS
jgi:hypothetical protein